MSFLDLKNQVTDFAKSLGQALGLIPEDNTLPYPSQMAAENLKSSGVNKILSQNWNKSLSYSFNVINIKNKSSSSQFSEFKLTIAPQAISQQENFAITITPTMGGIISEHNGIVLRDLMISGTTGIYPLRGTGGVTSKGKAIGTPDAKSGYEEFLQLRNYFRAYAFAKKDIKNKDRNDLRLIFINRKDNETWILEPISFNMERSSGRAKLYDYKITFKILSKYDYKDKENTLTGLDKVLSGADDILNTVSDALSTARGFLLAGSSIISGVEREVNNIFDVLRQVDLAVKTALGIIPQLSDFGHNIKNAIGSSLALQLLSALFAGTGEDDKEKALKATNDPATISASLESNANQIPADPANFPDNIAQMMADEQTKVMQMPKSTIQNLIKSLREIGDNLADTTGVGDAGYNEYAGRTSTIVPDPQRTPSSQEMQIMSSLKDAEQALTSLLVIYNETFKNNVDQYYANAENAFQNIISIPKPSTSIEVMIPDGYSVEDLADKYLGDMTRYPEIIELNSLVPPYIAETSTNKRVKTFGDKILIPSEGQTVNTNVQVVSENKYNTNMSETEKKMGIDIKLSKDFDFITNNQSDFEVSVGGYNAGQALKLKLNINQGELKLHKEIGVNLPIGEKTQNIDLIYDQIVGSILQDPRFTNIKNFKLTAVGDTVLISLDLSVIESDTPIPVTFPI